MIKDIGFKIKPTVEAKPAQKELAATRKQIKDISGEITLFNKLGKVALKDFTTQFKDWRKSLKDSSGEFRQWADTGISSINRFTGAFGRMKSSILNLRNVVATSFIGYETTKALRSIYAQGTSSISTRGRLSREFGDEANLLALSGRAAGAAGGVSEDAATRGLIPFREQLDAIEAGSRFRGMKGKLTADQAYTLRQNSLNYGAGLFSRLSTLAPDVNPDDAGRVLADALSGPEGIRSLIATFNLSKRSRALAQANEQGKAFQFLRPDERQRLGVTKQGQYLQQGDLVNLILERSGLTDKAAEDRRKKFDFQIRSMGATLENVFSDIGAKAIDKLSGGLAKGTTLAEKFQMAISSPEGKRIIEAITDDFVKLSEATVEIVRAIPKVGDFLSEHKTTLIALGAAYVGIKGMSAFGGKGGGGVGGLAGAAAGTPLSGGGLGVNVLGMAPAVLSAMTTAFAGGFALGNVIRKKFGTDDKIMNYMDEQFGTKDFMDEKQDEIAGYWKMKLAKDAGERETKIKAKMAGGLDRGRAIFEIDHPGQKASMPSLSDVPSRLLQAYTGLESLNAAASSRAALKSLAGTDKNLNRIGTVPGFGASGTGESLNVNLVLDGKTVTKALIPFFVHELKRASANGAAPVHQER